jgi:hypothetical protein
VDGYMDTLRVYENLSREVRLFRDFGQEDQWF